jgi:4'-phosphopantetheinyl transferase
MLFSSGRLPPEDEIHVWYARPEDISDPERLARWREVLSADEIARHDRFVQARDRHLFLVAHSLTRLVLSHYTEVSPAAWQFAAGPHGKPKVSGPTRHELRFNLSHAQGLAAVAVADGSEVGIDVECLNRSVSDGLVRDSLTDAEWTYWTGQPDNRRAQTFFRFWTLKEAYLKGCGVGLQRSLKEIAFELIAEQSPQISFIQENGINPTDWQFWQDFPGPQHVTAVAVHRPDRKAMSFRVQDAAELC